MRKLFAFLARPIVWSTGGLVLMLFILHVICPLLGVAEDKRWVIELVVGAPLAVLLVGYWGRQLWLERRLTSDIAAQAKKQALQQGPDTVRDFKALADDFTRAFTELGQACRERGVVGGVSTLPWVLIMGQPGVGKSTALERSGLRFTSLGRRLQGIGGTRDCTWWLASDAVFLDTAGRYAVRPDDQQEWRAFLHLLRRRRRRPIDAVLLQIGIDELIERPRAEVERVALQLRERLDELALFLQAQVPVHLLFNKCDVLDGFVDFFAALEAGERAQPWGFDLDGTASGSLHIAFAARFAELVRALTERTTRRLLSLREARSREAALAFPTELAGIGDTLAFFVANLFEQRARSERPLLCTVYLASAEQTGQCLQSTRQRRAEELALSGAARQPLRMAANATGAEGATYFLRGVYQQLIRQAEHAARPTAARQRRMRLHQRVAVAVAMAGCVAASAFLGGRYSGALRWLEQLKEDARRLADAPGVSRSAPRVTKEELLTELNHQEAVHALLADPPTGLPRGPVAAGNVFLRRRIEQQWLLPLQEQMQQDLDRAANHQGNDPGEYFSRGFGMLRLAHVLRGRACDGTDAEVTRQSLAQYVLEHWQRALSERGRFLAQSSSAADAEQAQAPGAKLRRQIELFFAQEPEELGASVRLRFDDQALERTRQALTYDSDDAGIVFNLRASMTNLYERSGQLSTALLGESGLERAFTTRGCALFFSKEASHGSEWWRCVLDRPLPKTPSNLDDVYRQRYAEAWNRWLHELTLQQRQPAAGKGQGTHAESLAEAIAALDMLAVRDARPALSQIMAVLGRGRDELPKLPGGKKGKPPWYAGCGKGVGKSMDGLSNAYQGMKVPSECKGALELFAPLNQLASKDKPAEEDADATGLREGYQKYLAAAKALRATLSRIDHSTDRYQEALKLVLATMGATGELFALESARDELISTLQNRMSGSGVEFRDSGFSTALREIESLIWRALLPLGTQALNEQWRNQLMPGWKTLNDRLKQQLANEEDQCKARTEFLRKDLGDFVNKFLAPLYVGGSLQSCSLKRMQPPFDRQLTLPDSVCVKLREGRRIGDETTDCTKAQGAGGGASKRDVQRADVQEPNQRPDVKGSKTQGCGFTAEEVLFDRGDKVFVCPQSTGICTESKERKTSQRAVLRIRWQNQPALYMAVYERDSPDELFRLATRAGNQVVFAVPPSAAPGHCDGFKLSLDLAPAGGGGGEIPKNADNRWRHYDPPPSLQ